MQLFVADFLLLIEILGVRDDNDFIVIIVNIVVLELTSKVNDVAVD